jgi:hypothetical protein
MLETYRPGLGEPVMYPSLPSWVDAWVIYDKALVL